MIEIYDRMHPDKNEFIKRIENYSKITYGTDAYSLSAKEALLILDLKAKYQKAVEALKFYADGEGEVLDWDRVNQQGCEQDRGRFARQTLSELGEKE